MSLRHRIGKLERRLSVAGRCRECARSGGCEVVEVHATRDDDGKVHVTEAPPPTACPECGRARRQIEIINFTGAPIPPVVPESEDQTTRR